MAGKRMRQARKHAICQTISFGEYQPIGKICRKERHRVSKTYSDVYCLASLKGIVGDDERLGSNAHNGGNVSRQIGHCSLYFIQPSRQGL